MQELSNIEETHFFIRPSIRVCQPWGERLSRFMQLEPPLTFIDGAKKSLYTKGGFLHLEWALIYFNTYGQETA